jgi:type IV pilus assembly protein PilF
MNFIRSKYLALLIFSLILVSQLLGCAVWNVKAANINTQLGLALLEKDDRAQAKKKLLLAKEQAPKEPAVWYAMAYFLEQTGDIPAAEQHYRYAIKLHSNVGAAQNNYGTFLCRRGRYQEALKEFDKAAMVPDYLEPAMAYVNAAVCAKKIPNELLAEHYFQKAAEKDPSFDINAHVIDRKVR